MYAKKSKKKKAKKKKGKMTDRIPKSKNPSRSVWGIPYSS